MAALPSRSVDEQHAYMGVHPCDCGDDTVEVWSGGAVHGVTRTERTYTWACPACGAPRRFDFYTLKERRARADQPYGEGLSEILDPGEWLVVGGAFADLAADRSRSRQDRRHGRWLAPAAIEEALKFIPPGADEVPRSAFTSEIGKVVRLVRPDWFHRDALLHRIKVFAKGRVVAEDTPWPGKATRRRQELLTSLTQRLEEAAGRGSDHSAVLAPEAVAEARELRELSAGFDLEATYVCALVHILRHTRRTLAGAHAADDLAEALRLFRVVRAAESVSFPKTWLAAGPPEQGALVIPEPVRLVLESHDAG
ncbi:hypothetical protein ACFWY9_24070 [Amycolatopsis sp. NPDC059027]|uniref:hypothetical protein n=1 Tax=Amycolatopsis sp. NPDC059027 TaxID=3346709 RepID=UPI00366D5ED0